MKKEALPLHTFPDKNAGKLSFHFMQWGSHNQLYDSSVPHRHDYNQLLVFFEGGGMHEIDFTEYPIRDHSLHFVAGGQSHLVRRARSSSGCSLLFSDEFFYLNQADHRFLAELPFLEPDLNPVVPFDEHSFKRIRTLVDQIQEEYSGTQVHREDIIRSCLHIMLVEAKRNWSKGIPQAGLIKDGTVQQFKKLIGQHYLEHWSVSKYAELLHITPNYLSELCRNECGKTAGNLIQERILLEAKRLLFNSRESVKEIAFTLNFGDPAYFTRFFKKHTGVSPADYRK